MTPTTYAVNNTKWKVKKSLKDFQTHIWVETNIWVTIVPSSSLAWKDIYETLWTSVLLSLLHVSFFSKKTRTNVNLPQIGYQQQKQKCDPTQVYLCEAMSLTVITYTSPSDGMLTESGKSGQIRKHTCLSPATVNCKFWKKSGASGALLLLWWKASGSLVLVLCG